MDDSDQAGYALEYALDNYPDAEVTGLHVVGVPSMMMADTVSLTLEDDINEAAAERAEPVFDRAHKISDEWDREIESAQCADFWSGTSLRRCRSGFRYRLRSSTDSSLQNPTGLTRSRSNPQ